MTRRWILSLTLAATPLFAQSPAEPVDAATIARIITEASDKSQVMATMSWLTDVGGQRLTGSPELRRSAEWAAAQLKGWGVQNVALEPWQNSFRGWSNQKLAVRVTAPTAYPVLAAPRAWSVGTNGAISGAAIAVVVDSASDTLKYKGQLRGKIVLWGRPRTVPAQFTAQATRLTDEQLATMEAYTPPPSGAPGQNFNFPRVALGNADIQRFLASEGAAGLFMAARGDGGTIFTDNGSPKDAAAPQVPTVHVAIESYGRIWRTLDQKVPVTVEMEMQNSFHDDGMNQFSIVGEIPGTDPKLKDEVVMLGAHFDSWQAGTGATDNAAGSAVMLEAMRIFRALDLKPRRTIRIGLWSGEEQGLLGSRAYVKAHFGERRGDTLFLKPEQAKLAGYFNVDNGTGKIRGVYQQMNAGVGPVFRAWMAPFAERGMKTTTLQNTGGTDHQAFDPLGIPGFQFIQDGLEYNTRTHHSNMDTYERIQADDMKHNAAVVASFVWQTAQREALLPRKPFDSKLIVVPPAAPAKGKKKAA
ncbi:MAG: M20/M25/M40 family metallo-hydrolase [Gemmatimonadaceae bacterium]|nr:M20/M25/M40 family metallo-hydrolase [Gemmatimonadaceae bacterium]